MFPLFTESLYQKEKKAIFNKAMLIGNNQALFVYKLASDCFIICSAIFMVK